MDANNELLLWYLAYRDRLAANAALGMSRLPTRDGRLLRRRRLARWCGHVALRLGTWLLADERWTGAPPTDGSDHQPVLSHYGRVEL